MKKLFLLAWPIALAAVSCSNEEVVSVNNDANEITFTATAENATRAADAFCNAFMPENFNVWARADNAQYFANVLYTKESGKTTYKAAGGEVHFWPAKEIAVSFWAAKNHNNEGEGKFIWPGNTGTPTIEFQPATTASAQHDLLYAYTVQNRPDYDVNKIGVVPMNFRHALSQIVFKASVSNPTIKVQIDQVQVCRINGKGTFTYPDAVTDTNYPNHANGEQTETGTGKWVMSTTEATDVDYTTGQFTAVTITNGKTENLTEETTTETGHKTTRDFGHSLLLLPQKTTAWSHTPGTTDTGVDKEGAATGAYFLVYCKIWNVSGATSNGADLLLWGNKVTGEGESVTYTTKAVAIPVTINWLPGRKYIYTFKFGSNTTGGFDPDNGQDVLIPISFDVKVDDFVNVTDTPVWMGPNETPATEPEP